MKISYSPYTLKPAHHLNALTTQTEGRPGALLKVEWPDGLMGFSDLHPWVEFGDASWEDHLAELRRGRILPLLEQSIWMARKDAQFRKLGKSAFEGVTSVKNNYLVTDLTAEPAGTLADRLQTEGFDSVKLKVGRDLKYEADFLNSLGREGQFKIRLDFNSIGTWSTFERFMKSLDKVVLSRIQYVEDPFPFESESWTEARRFAPVAVDQQISRVDFKNISGRPFDVVILKPAKTDVNTTLHSCVAHDFKITVTSYMDHPVGVMHALAIASELKKSHPQRVLDAGCMTLKLFQMTAYSAEVLSAGPYIKRPPGKGIGFDLLLAKEPWVQLKLR